MWRNRFDFMFDKIKPLLNGDQRFKMVFKYIMQILITSLLLTLKCEPYLCDINRLDLLEEVNLIWLSQSTLCSNYMY